MRYVSDIFDTKAEAEAFALGVEWVNDSAVELDALAPMPGGRPGFVVVHTDEDGEAVNLTRDHRTAVPA